MRIIDSNFIIQIVKKWMKLQKGRIRMTSWAWPHPGHERRVGHHCNNYIVNEEALNEHADYKRGVPWALEAEMIKYGRVR